MPRLTVKTQGAKKRWGDMHKTTEAQEEWQEDEQTWSAWCRSLQLRASAEQAKTTDRLQRGAIS